MRFRDLRMTRIKDAIYPEGQGPPALSPEELRGLPEPTHRWLSQFIGGSSNRRNIALPLDFPDHVVNRRQRRSNVRSTRQRLTPLTQIHLPWKPQKDNNTD